MAGRGKTHATGAGRGVALPSGGARRGGREPGKSDPIERPTGSTATTVCVRWAASRPSQMPAVLQRGPNLPPTSSARGRVCWPLDGPCREVTLLSDYRRDLVKQRKRVVNRLRWHLHELDPTLQIPPRGLRRYCVIDASHRAP